MDKPSKPSDLGFGEFYRFAQMYRLAMEVRGLTQVAVAKAVYGRLEYKDWQSAQSRLSKFLQDGEWPPGELKVWIAPLDLSDHDAALMYRRGIEEFAPAYVQEIIAHFSAAYGSILAGHTIPPLNDVLFGRFRGHG